MIWQNRKEKKIHLLSKNDETGDRVEDVITVGRDTQEKREKKWQKKGGTSHMPRLLMLVSVLG